MNVFANIRIKNDFADILCSSRELPPRHVRSTFVLSEGLLTSATFRLNSRNSILERSADLHPQSTLYRNSPITQQQKEPTHESTSRPTAIPVNMHQTTISDFAPCKHNYNAEPKSLDVEKSVRSLLLMQCPHSHVRLYRRMKLTLPIWVLNDRSLRQSCKVFSEW